ncbi:hypothetical protein [Amedibacillus sp. YH-ame10]
MDFIKKNLFVILLYLFVFQNLFENIQFVSLFKYYDELYSFLFFPLFVICRRKNPNKKFFDINDKKIFLLNFILFIIGCFSTINNTRPLTSILPDIVICFKFVLSIYTTILLLKLLDIHKNINNLNKHLRLLTLFLFLLFILDIVFNLFPSGYLRFGIRSMQLIFEHPGRLVTVGVFLLAFLVYLENFRINNKKYILLCIVLIASTLRAKAFGTILFFIILYYWIIVKNKKISIKHFIIASPFAAFASWQQISDYYLVNSQASRLLLTETSFKIANDYFPLGSGFSSFGSAYSIRPYSSFYYSYDLWDKWGVSVEWNQDISDTFWPMILGQFGYIGLLIYIGSLICLIVKIQSLQKISQYFYTSGLLIITSLLISSTSESAFVHPFSVSLGFLLGILLNERNYKNGEI